MLDRINENLRRIEHEINDIRNILNPPDERPFLVRAGENLQAALDEHANVELEAGVTFEGTFLMRRPNSILSGNRSKLQGRHGPALKVPINIHGIVLNDLDGNTDHDGPVFLLGENTNNQTSIDSVPRDIVLNRVSSHGHRGKRGIEINSSNTVLLNCEILDLHDPAARDSQAVLIMNTPGNITIDGGIFEAASENILVGGDRMKIPHTRPDVILMQNFEVFKSLSWKDVIPSIKNLIELKDGHNVTIRNITGRNCWRSGQDGWAFVFTPVLGASLLNVQVIDCNIENVGGIVQILGVDLNRENTFRSQISFNGGTYQTNRAAMGGRGIFSTITSGPEYLDVENIIVENDGNAFIQLGDSRPIDRLHVRNSVWNARNYGIIVNGQMYANNSAGLVTDFQVDGNTINTSGMNSTQRRLLMENIPNNTFTP